MAVVVTYGCHSTNLIIHGLDRTTRSSEALQRNYMEGGGGEHLVLTYNNSKTNYELFTIAIYFSWFVVDQMLLIWYLIGKFGGFNQSL